MSVSRSYARALLEAARESGVTATEIERMDSELGSFVSALKANPALLESLTSPVVSTAEKSAVAGEVAARMGLPKLVQLFVALVARSGRMGAMEAIANGFTVARLEGEGATLGEVVSADALRKEDVEELATAFTRRFGKKVVFKTAVDPRLIAGLKVSVDGTTYDGSLRAQLDRLEDRLVFGKSGLTLNV